MPDVSFTLNFKKTFDLYFRSLVMFARQFRICEEECESIVQDSFVALWEKRNDFPDYFAVRAYLYTTVKGKALNILHHRKTEANYVSQRLQTEENEINFMKSVIQEETQRLLFTAIESLPEQPRKILLLNLEGKSNPEIAELLNMSVDNVKFHKKSAYKILREQLKEQFYLILPFIC